MKQGFALRTSQNLALTPQLQQAIRLLQISTLDLQQEVEQVLADNPFLEREEADQEYGTGAQDKTREAHAMADGDFAGDDAGVSSPAQDIPAQGDASAFEQSSAGSSDEALNLDTAWGGHDDTVDIADEHTMDGGDWGNAAPGVSQRGNDEAQASDLASGHISLQSHLHRQALALHLCEEDQAALYFLIESLDDDGYLEDSLRELAFSLAEDGEIQTLEGMQRIDEVEQQLGVALLLLQSLDPAGVGARDLSECLRLQLQALRADGGEDTANARQEKAAQVHAALEICTPQGIGLLARRDVRKLTQSCGLHEDDVRAAMALIARLEPKPGRRFVDLSCNEVVPDVIVRRVQAGKGQERFQVQINPDVMPRLRVNDVYANALKAHRNEASAALQQRLQEARWFIKNIQQRFDTILRVSSAIVERQKNFFIHGELAMRPLVLREIADELGLHESTVSRVTTAKYMDTPFGTVELKHFFGSGLSTETGGSASSTAVRALIKQLIADENPKKPLSDNKISDMLKAQGIDCARRTVAKYREAMRIAPTNLRKVL